MVATTLSPVVVVVRPRLLESGLTGRLFASPVAEALRLGTIDTVLCSVTSRGVVSSEGLDPFAAVFDILLLGGCENRCRARLDREWPRPWLQE